MRKLAAALGTVLLPFLASAVQAQTVTNTAEVSWTENGSAYSASSNTVSFTVRPLPTAIDTLRIDRAGGLPTGVTASRCGGRPIPFAGGSADAAVAMLTPTATLKIGEQLFFRFSSAAANLDSGAVDSLMAVLQTASGDRETITVFETAPDSGVFLGVMPTSPIPPSPVIGDCTLSVNAGDHIEIGIGKTSLTPIASAAVDVLADPFGLVFDSEDGSPIDGVTITLIEAVSGAPARVFADDGVTTWPSTVVSGQPVTDGAGRVNPMPAGEYRFPLAALGTYRLVFSPPAPYTAPSTATPAQLAGILRPDGEPVLIAAGSYGGTISLSSPAPVRIDVPLDRPGVAVGLSKTVSRARAAPGDVVFYTVTATNSDPAKIKRQVVLTDTPSRWLRLRADSIRLDGAAAPTVVQVSADGSTLAVALGDLAPGARRTVTYAMSVRDDAPPGQAVNRAEAVDARGNRTQASAALRIERETIAGRMTLIGRITDGGCDAGTAHRGIPGVRVMLQDGSFAITDADGRYHFEGLVPGTHVVQAAASTLPRGGVFTDCNRSTRSAGSASSQFVIGQGGSLIVADFAATLPEPQAPAAPPPSETPDDNGRAAAGAETDWLAMGDGPDGFLFPEIDHNPRAPAIRVVIRHRKGQTVELFSDGKPVDKVAFDGARNAANGAYAVSIWRGIPLSDEVTHLSATLRSADGAAVQTLKRDVHFSATPARVELLAEKSQLVADGATRPVVAVRVLDRFGRPVHSGLSGEFRVSAPYESAAEIDAMQLRTLSGQGRAAPTWTVKGEDGIALIELSPTMVSGKLSLDFNFTDGEIRRRQTIESWIVPGDQKWTLIGLAEGSVGEKTVADNMERSGRFDSDLGDKARVAVYAKGRVLGRFLVTAAYDSAKQRDDQRLLGAIDPNAYYTVFADGSDRRFDAASREKLYVRIEAAGFYALYGDFVSGFDQTQLARDQRTATGIKAEGSFGGLHVAGFAAKTAQSHRRDEFQGGGISGPYRLSSRAIIANSEIVTLEVRDRFRSELIVTRRTLTRFTDYDIDLLAGTITFKEPVLSRDAALNPQFIVIDFEVDGTGGDKINGGLRADYTTANGAVRIGATAITDTGAADGTRTNLGGVDIKAKLGDETELRAEAALSRKGGETANAWLVEVEHHDGNLDVLAYARSADQQFGIGQMNGAERGRRKFGADARLNLGEEWSVTGSAWHDDSLTDSASRNAVELAAAWRTRDTEARLGVAAFHDTLQDGTTARSTVLEGGVTQRLLDSKLELSAASSLALGNTDSIDLPQRHRFGLRYALTRDIKLVGAYEIADGDAIDARTLRAGLEVMPWTGAKLLGTLGQQSVSEFGKRSYAALGLAQSLELSSKLTIDATAESSKTLGGFDAGALINPEHPAASGGYLGEAGTVAEDFTALTLGGTWRDGRWSATLRGELRDGELANRRGVTFGAIRQLGEGSIAGAGFSWTRARGENGAASEIFDAAISAAHRPAGSVLAFLTKLEYRSDAITNAIAGEAGPAGRTALTIDGDAKARRLIGSISANWSPKDDLDGQLVQRTQIGVFLAVRHNFDRFQGLELSGTSLLGAIDARIGLGDWLEIGAAGSLRHSLSDGATSFSAGPQLGISPAKDTLLIFGYNFTGYRDRDFGAARFTNRGLFATLRLKFDADSLEMLGLGER